MRPAVAGYCETCCCLSMCLVAGASLKIQHGTTQLRRLRGAQKQVAFAKPIKVPDIIDRETELKPQQLREYFERIELPEQLRNERRLGRLDSELLQAIVKGHVSHIPFENLSLVSACS